MITVNIIKTFERRKFKMENNYIYMQESRWSNTKLCSISKPKGGGGYLINLTSLGGVVLC